MESAIFQQRPLSDSLSALSLGLSACSNGFNDPNDLNVLNRKRKLKELNNVPQGVFVIRRPA